ncbi:hypothetical protein LES60_01960 [Pectobacterium brasiliense]|uniref:hypothetical protein n=1 Tax=Pectobacterium brasiliense TaxID=180957 RepID=UPI001CE15FBA|nr:hypothetical protein [Pectobacterium brasiliense]MCA5918994.1 hypothetical protein [Pectobacterium brasiliense]MCA5925439.1 hypothetical protein [Pectobacterium brasiliense]MCA5934858.1 hypothetical protein [Pectobacterium brasiliense]MCA5941412.1 hypothetical protein [Pectobacterium brasiliense]MCA5944917.1 hypothetical protein [Pectobacterium brasiliense]
MSSVGSDFNGTSTLKQALNGRKLKEWVTSNKDKLNVEISIHPTQKEKIGIIPSNEKYEYTSEQKTIKPTSEQKTIKSMSRGNKKQVTINFILMLGSLAPDEADKIVIPTSVLSKLLGE